MKQLIVTMLCLLTLISLAGCGASLWAYTDDGADNLGIRGGLVADRFEFGADNLRQNYDEGSGDWDAYALVHIMPGEFFDPYFGATSDTLKISNESDLEPVYGSKFGPVFIEYQDRTDDIFFGLGHTWRW